ncbi:hypothetical protein CDAR_375001 [Caerostris darwini]|uniref:Uncharacterized protein n=1 Tax=Caerostris darwini TaxID=1538125 RepID=A0AAV4RND3_9ARAC|nr:hypothetical protein CDAR_375001 [Caerostris darwini]
MKLHFLGEKTLLLLPVKRKEWEQDGFFLSGDAISCFLFICSRNRMHQRLICFSGLFKKIRAYRETASTTAFTFLQRSGFFPTLIHENALLHGFLGQSIRSRLLI